MFLELIMNLFVQRCYKFKTLPPVGTRIGLKYLNMSQNFSSWGLVLLYSVNLADRYLLRNSTFFMLPRSAASTLFCVALFCTDLCSLAFFCYSVNCIIPFLPPSCQS